MRKLLISLLCVIMVVCFMPTMAFAAEGETPAAPTDPAPADTTPKGSIEAISDVAVVSGDTITVSGSSLQHYKKDDSVGRYMDGWWIGFNIVAPESVTDANVNSVKYSNDGTDTLAPNFGNNNDGKTADGRYYMGCWLPVMPEYLEGALAAGSKLQWTYKFDWNGDGTLDQTIKAIVNPNDITLNKDGKVHCKTENGVMTVKNGFSTQGSIEKITDIAEVSGNTITVSGCSLQWFPADGSVGRNQDGWWVGFKIVAPEDMTAENVAKVTYSNDGTDNLAKNFGTNRDGDFYMGCWVPVTQEYLENALKKGTKLQWTYKFNWDGDGNNTVEQTFKAIVDPNNITLNKDGKVECKTENGVMTVKDGEPVRPSTPYIPTVTDPLKPAKTEASNAVEKYVDAKDYEAEDQTAIKAIVDKAKKDIEAAKTADEIKAIEAAAKAEIDKYETSEEKALIKEIEEIKLVARSKQVKMKSGKKAVKIIWKTTDGKKVEFDGVEIYRSVKRYSGYGKKPFFSTTKDRYYNTKIKTGTKYYYRVRGFKYVNDEKVYTEYSLKAWRTVR